LRTIERGLSHFEKTAYRAQSRDKQISGEDAFKLHETYGFPIDLTRQMALERGLAVDEVEFERFKKEHEQKSRESAKKQTFQSVTWMGAAEETDDSAKYKLSKEPLSAMIMCWVKDNEATHLEDIPEDEKIALVLD